MSKRLPDLGWRLIVPCCAWAALSVGLTAWLVADTLRPWPFLLAGGVLSLAAGLALAAGVAGRTASILRENRRLAHRAAHDALTGLVNRGQFEAALAQQLPACERHGAPLAVLFIDVDGFKAVNDTHGHAVGDELLRMFAARLRAAVRGANLVARLGGDEFGVLLGGASPAQALGVADGLIDRLSRPYAIDGQRVDVSASIGLAHHPDGGTTAEALLCTADAAMYRAKQAGKRRYAVSDFARLP